MDWNAHVPCWEFHLEVLHEASWDFKFLVEGDWDQVVYPNKPNAIPGDGHTILGPDDGTSGQGDEIWTIQNAAAEDFCFKIRLFLSSDGKPSHVNWERFDRKDDAEAQKAATAEVEKCNNQLNSDIVQETAPAQTPPAWSVIGTWDDYEQHDMDWNAELQCLEFIQQIAPGKTSSFKFMFESDWDQMLYPDRENAGIDDGHTLKGPDDKGTDETWTIDCTQEEVAVDFKIRMFLLPEGSPKRVDWVRLDGKTQPP